MMVTDHLLAGACVTIWATERKKSVGMCLAAGLVSHYLLDLIPHIEPSSLGGSHLIMWSAPWIWAASDNVLGFLLLAWLVRNVPKLRDWRLIPITFGAYAPDVMTSLVMAGHLTDSDWLRADAIHVSAHLWWRGWFGEVPAWWGWLLGGSTTLITFCATLPYVLHFKAPPTVTTSEIETADLVAGV